MESWAEARTLVVVGLGNPGREYSATRHNLGFKVVEFLARRLNMPISQRGLRSRFGRGRFGNDNLLLVLPQTFMNLSGRAIKGFLASYRVPIDRLLVICDDLNLPPGSLRIRPAGSDGGHKGLRSIIEELGNQDFPRLRLGIGLPPPELDAADFVLLPMSREELDRFTPTIERAAQVVQCWLEQGIEASMNLFNSRDEQV